LSEENINKLSVETKFNQRSNGLISGYEILMLLINSGFGEEKLSLDNLCEDYEEQTGKTITKQSLDARFNTKLRDFIYLVLKKVFKNNAKEIAIENEYLKQFKTIRIKDSTSFQLPEVLLEHFKGCGGSAGKSGVKIQFEYDYLSGEIYELTIEHGKNSDLSNARNTLDLINNNDLIIRDLGYIEIPILSKIDAKKAYYLNKIKDDINIYRKKGDRFVLYNFSALERYMKIYGITILDKMVYVGAEHKYLTRMIIELVPEDVKKERIKKKKDNAKSRKTEVKQCKLIRCGFNIFVTNLNFEQLPLTQARNLYRLRWQIELIFKIWKSIGKIHIIQKMKYERFISCLYAKLLWFFTNWKILWSISLDLFETEKKLISFYKAFSSLSRKKEKFNIFNQTKDSIAKFIDILFSKSKRYYLLEKKNKKLSSIEILIETVLLIKNKKY